MAEAKVLIVDDNSQNIQLAANHLKEEKISMAFARSGPEALEIIEEEQFDLLLLDVMMPEMDGFELCRRTKQLPLYRDVPVIFLTARDDKESVLKGFEAGAVDYIAKPFFGPELLSRVRTHLRLRGAISQLENINAQLNRDIMQSLEKEQELIASAEQLQESNRLLYQQATRDPVTGLANRRSLTALAEYEHGRLERSKGSMAIVIGDIDNFKVTNDTHGHACGDRVLAAVGGVLRETVRKQDQVARWGGEEFLVLLPDTNASGASTVAEKIRGAVQELTTDCEGVPIRITITLGVAECRAETPLAEVIKRADQALYEGKRGGRNQVRVSR